MLAFYEPLAELGEPGLAWLIGNLGALVDSANAKLAEAQQRAEAAEACCEATHPQIEALSVKSAEAQQREARLVAEINTDRGPNAWHGVNHYREHLRRLRGLNDAAREGGEK